jgi:hypothetical protein
MTGECAAEKGMTSLIWRFVSPIDLAHHDIKSSIFPGKPAFFSLDAPYDAPFGEDSEL